MVLRFHWGKPFFLALALFVVGCTGQMRVSKNTLSSSLGSSSCTDFNAKIFDPLIQSVQEGDVLPSVSQFESEVAQQLDTATAASSWSADQKSKYAKSLARVYSQIQSTVADQTAGVSGVKVQAELVKALSAMETKDPHVVSTQAMADLQSSIDDLRVISLQLDLNCQANPGRISKDSELFVGLKALAHPAVYGAHKVTATAYQSCDTLKRDPMNRNTPDVEGIAIVGTHEDGVGQQRQIASVADVVSTDYYLAGYQRAQTACTDVSLNPLIYDYGGKPYASAGNTGTLDLFKDAGSGTTALGVDCSGYVFSAYASAGLKMATDQVLKAQNVYSINAARFMNAPNEGFNCFAYAPVSRSESLRAGDVIASGGHVVMVDWVSRDPLGISGITTASDCRLGPISYQKFDFVISQSAPIKGGIGINRILAKDYFTSGDMRTGLEQYAIRACQAKFNGQTTTPSLADIGIIRHKGTAECRATEVALEKQSCLSVCRL